MLFLFYIKFFALALVPFYLKMKKKNSMVLYYIMTFPETSMHRHYGAPDI